MFRYTRCNLVIFMAATAWLMLSFSSCIVCGFDSYTVLFNCSQRKVRYTNQIRTRYRNWRTTSATQLQPSKSLCYNGYTSTWWQHDCWPTVQTLYAIYILTPERISQGHTQNGKRATFLWSTLYIYICTFNLLTLVFKYIQILICLSMFYICFVDLKTPWM